MNMRRYYSGTTNRRITRREESLAGRSVFDNGESKGNEAVICSIERTVGSIDRRGRHIVEFQTAVDARHATKAASEIDSPVTETGD